MQAIFAKGNQRTVNKIISLRKGALAEHQYRVATRLHAIMLSIEKYTSGDIADLLKVNRTNVPVWINNWNNHGADGLLEGHRSGRRSGLAPEDKGRNVVISTVRYNRKDWINPVIQGSPFALVVKTEGISL